MIKTEFFYTVLNEFSIVAVTDRRGIIIYANEKFCKISHYSKEELIGQNHRIVKSGIHTKAFYNDLWSTISSGKIWRGEICNKAKNGEYYWVDTFIIPEMGADGNAERYYSMRIDITERKSQELEIFKQKQDLERIAAMQSHQVRRPVANVIGLIDLIDDTDLNAANKELYDLLKISAKELETTIMDIVKKAQ